MANGELVIIAYLRVEAHDIDLLNGLILPCGVAWRRFALRTGHHEYRMDSVAIWDQRDCVHHQNHNTIKS